MSAYIVIADDCHMAKIGFSHNPWPRLSAMQANSPVALRLAAIMPDDGPSEAELHMKFAQFRVRGDWFRLSPEIAEFISAFGTPERPIDGRKLRWALERARASVKAA